METFSPQNNFIIQASNGILSNMKVEDLVIIQEVQVMDQDTLGLGFWPLVNPNQLHWANQGIARRWGLWWIWGSFHVCIELIEARVSSLSHFIRRLGLRLISALPNSSISWKSQLWSIVHDFMDLEVGESWIHFIHVGTSFIWHVKAQEWRK